MRYRFHEFEVGPFKVYQSDSVKGDAHLKRFITAGVTPQTQSTLNIYASGEFECVTKDFKQVMPAGSTSLDLLIKKFPLREIFTERVLSAEATRYCVSPQVKEPWIKLHVHLSSDSVYELGSNEIAYILSGSVKNVGAGMVEAFFVGLGTLTATQDTRLVVASTKKRLY